MDNPAEFARCVRKALDSVDMAAWESWCLDTSIIRQGQILRNTTRLSVTSPHLAYRICFTYSHVEFFKLQIGRAVQLKIVDANFYTSESRRKRKRTWQESIRDIHGLVGAACWRLLLQNDFDDPKSDSTLWHVEKFQNLSKS
jgi:hypothetical protein